MQSIRLFSHVAAPNPMKVALIIEALGLPYEIKLLDFSEVKTEAFLKITPNGRLPAIEDPNTGLILWESGAIIQYLVDKYDKAGQISLQTEPEKYLAQQWLAFQISGQGPYFGQATWFARFHPEKIQSAIDRYANEIIRVIGVLELGLERNATGWLVGNRCTYADLAFVPWSQIGEGLLKEIGRRDLEEEYPLYTAWNLKLNERDDVKVIKARMAKGRAGLGLPQ